MALSSLMSKLYTGAFGLKMFKAFDELRIFLVILELQRKTRTIQLLQEGLCKSQRLKRFLALL